MMQSVGASVRWTTVWLVLFGWSAAGAQTTRPADATATIDYADPAFGFEVRLPVGWNYDRTRFQQFKDSLGLLRGTAPGGNRGMQIMVFRTFDMRPFEDWLVDFGKASAELMNSERVDWETWRLPPRAGAILTYTAKLSTGETRSHCLCLPFDPTTTWILIYSGTTFTPEDRAAVRAEFDALVATLRVHYDPEEMERLAPAYECGRSLLRDLRRKAEGLHLDERPRSYEIMIGGASVGFLERRVRRDRYTLTRSLIRRPDEKAGVRIEEWSWRFDEGGTAQVAYLNAFSSFDMQTEAVVHESTIVPPAGAAAPEPFTRRLEAARESDVLLTTVTTSRAIGLPDPSKPMNVGPLYLDQVWVRLLPGMLLSYDDPPEHAFAVYNLETQALLAHRIRLLGERSIPEYSEPVFAFEVREGFIAPPSLLFVDARGVLLRLESGDVVLRHAAPEEIERRFGERRRAAVERLRAPRPAPREDTPPAPVPRRASR